MHTSTACSQQIVFLTHISRSGSTLLSKLLDEYDDICVTTEGEIPLELFGVKSYVPIVFSSQKQLLGYIKIVLIKTRVSSWNIPEKTIRYDSKDLYYQVGRLFGELGSKDELRRIIDNLMTRDDIDIRDRLDFGQVYISQLDSFEMGRTIFEDLYADFKEIEKGDRLTNSKEMEEWRQSFTQIVSSLVYTYKQLDMKPKAELVLADWLEKNPNDPVAQKLMEDLKKE